MRPYAELERDARDESPFSNSTDGCAWLDNWCGDCIHDKPAREGDDGNGCPLILLSLIGKTPIEWLEQPWGEVRGRPGTYAPVLGDTYHCIEYRPEDDGGDSPPKAPEPMPGQGELFDGGDYEGVRMFTDVVAEVKPERVS